MTGGRNINNKDRTILLRLAMELYQSSSRSRRFKTKTAEGRVTTEMKLANLGVIHGIRFSAVVSTNEGDLTVDYIVRPFDLKYLNPDFWSDGLPGGMTMAELQELAESLAELN